MAARKPPRNGRPWTPEKVRERIKLGMIADRLNKQALDEASMSDEARDAAKFLFSQLIAKAEAPRTLNVNLSLADLIKQSVNARDQ